MSDLYRRRHQFLARNPDHGLPPNTNPTFVIRTATNRALLYTHKHTHTHTTSALLYTHQLDLVHGVVDLSRAVWSAEAACNAYHQDLGDHVAKMYRLSAD